MILVDTSVWIDHLRRGEELLSRRLTQNAVATHPMVIGELALGGLRNRAVFLADLAALPAVALATDEEVLRFIAERHLDGRGIGYVDAHLLAAVVLSPGTQLWTNDARLAMIAKNLGVGDHP